MGWKTSCIIASQRENARLSEGPPHDRAMADKVAAAVIGDNVYLGESTFEYGSYASEETLYVGAYPQTILLGHVGITTTCFNDDIPPVVRTLDQFLPSATILALERHSVICQYGYALFRNNQILRSRSGSADDGIYHDIGQPLPEELPLFAQAIINKEGEQVWPVSTENGVEELDHSSTGEEFVFEVSRRAFGERFDNFDHSRLVMSQYKPRSRTFWQRWLTR